MINEESLEQLRHDALLKLLQRDHGVGVAKAARPAIDRPIVVKPCRLHNIGLAVWLRGAVDADICADVRSIFTAPVLATFAATLANDDGLKPQSSLPPANLIPQELAQVRSSILKKVFEL